MLGSNTCLRREIKCSNYRCWLNINHVYLIYSLKSFEEQGGEFWQNNYLLLRFTLLLIL